MTEELLTNAYIKGASDLLQGKIEGMPKIVVIPDGATNRDILQAIFTNMEMQEPYVEMQSGVIETREHYCRFCCTGSLDWWNAPYKAESEG